MKIEIAQANTGVNIGQILRGDRKDAVVKAKRIFRGKAFKSVVDVMEEATEKLGLTPEN